MSNSLQDQLLKAGLATKQGARNAQAEKRRRNKQKKKKGTVEVSELESQVEQARLEKQAKDKALNDEIKQQAERKADIAKVKQMIKQHGLTDIKGEIDFNFTFDKKVKKVIVDEKARDALVTGRLGICVLANEQNDDEDYYLLADETVRRIANIDDSVVAYLYDRAAGEAEPEMAEDDPYAEYQIPDDLMW